MKTIQVPTRDQVDATSQGVFDNLKSALGMVPNLYAAIGYSSNALTSFLAFSDGASKGSFNNKEVEAIKLAVSEANNCNYCKSAHTVIAKGAGYTEEETKQLRALTIEDAKLNAIVKLAYDIAKNAGHVSNENKEAFFAQGYDEKALIDLVAVVTAVTFTNFAFGVTQVPIDFPLAENV